MSKMEPFEFYISFFCEDYDDWKKEPHSLRRAFHVSVSAFHLADHFFRYHKRHDAVFAAKYAELEDFQSALTVRTRGFKTIQDVANTYKHLYTRARCSIASGGAIESVQYRGQEIEHDWDQPGSPSGNIVINHRDGTKTRFSNAIAEVEKLWQDIMSSSSSMV